VRTLMQAGMIDAGRDSVASSRSQRAAAAQLSARPAAHWVLRDGRAAYGLTEVIITSYLSTDRVFCDV
jgi:hypothetical protein